MLKDAGGLIMFIFLPERMKFADLNFLSHLPKIKKAQYHSWCHEKDSLDATHHGFHLYSFTNIKTWKLFQETSIPFLKSLKGLLISVEELLWQFLPWNGSDRKNKFQKTSVSLVLFGLLWFSIPVFLNGILIEEIVD